MAATDFLHGVEVIEIDDGPRPIRTVNSAIIGIIGTAPDANEAEFPLNQPVLIAGSRLKAAKLDTTGKRKGTLPNAIDLIFDQIGAVVIVVRVEDGSEQEEMARVLGGVSAEGQYLGMHAFIGAKSLLGISPRILLAPGYTHQRPVGISEIELVNNGSNYTKADVVIVGGGGQGAKATANIIAGKIDSIIITASGNGYTDIPEIKIEGDGSGATAIAKTAPAINPVAAEAVGICERLRAIMLLDGPNSSDEAAIAYAKDFGSKRLFLIDPFIKVSRSLNNDVNIVSEPASPAIAGLIAKTDYEKGFWWSPSNKTLSGISGTARPIDFALGDISSRANLLNAQNIATIICEDGYRLWGNRTLSDDSKWTFLSVVRTADMINDSILRAHLWAVDRNISKTYFDDVSESVNAYLRELKALGAILGGTCYPDSELNNATAIADGKVYFNIEFTPPYPAEHIIFRSRLTDDYLEELV